MVIRCNGCHRPSPSWAPPARSRAWVLVGAGEHRVLVDCRALPGGPKRLRKRNWLRLPSTPRPSTPWCWPTPTSTTAGTCPASCRTVHRAGLRHVARALPGRHRPARQRATSTGRPASPTAGATRSTTRPSRCTHRGTRPGRPWSGSSTCPGGIETEVVPVRGRDPRWAGHIPWAPPSLSVRLGDPAGCLQRGPRPPRPPDPARPTRSAGSRPSWSESTYWDESWPRATPSAGWPRSSAGWRRGGVGGHPASRWTDRTEVVLWHLRELQRAGRVPVLPVFVDSLMASRASPPPEAAAEHSSDIRPELWDRPLLSDLRLPPGPHREGVPGPRRAPRSHSCSSRPPGMATGGRILHHLAAPPRRPPQRRGARRLPGPQAPRGGAGGGPHPPMFGLYHRVRAGRSPASCCPAPRRPRRPAHLLGTTAPRRSSWCTASPGGRVPRRRRRPHLDCPPSSPATASVRLRRPTLRPRLKPSRLGRFRGMAMRPIGEDGEAGSDGIRDRGVGGRRQRVRPRGHRGGPQGPLEGRRLPVPGSLAALVSHQVVKLVFTGSRAPNESPDPMGPLTPRCRCGPSWAWPSPSGVVGPPRRPAPRRQGLGGATSRSRQPPTVPERCARRPTIGG